jgi:hypothetical protein
MTTKRWGTVLIVLGIGLLIGGYFIYLITDQSLRALWLFGFVLALSGATMRQRSRAATTARRSGGEQTSDA